MSVTATAAVDNPELVAWELSGSAASFDRSGGADEIIEALAGFTPGLRVLLTGIEGVARADLVTIVEDSTSAGLEVTITPQDPRVLDRSLLRHLVSVGLTAVSVPLDGPDRQTHDIIHGHPGHFDAAVGVTRWATDLGLPVEVTTAVGRSTLDWIDHLAARVLALAATRWSLSFIIPDERGVDREAVRPNEAEEMLEWLVGLDTATAVDIAIVQAPMYERIALSASPQHDTAASSLVAGDNLLYIGPDGTIAPSGALEIDLGRIPDDDLVELYRSDPLLQSIRDPSTRKGKCGICEFNEVCGGSRSRAYANFGDPLQQDPLCPFVPAMVARTG